MGSLVGDLWWCCANCATGKHQVSCWNKNSRWCLVCYSHSESKWDVAICTASCVVIFFSVEVWSGAWKTSIELKLVKDKNIVFKTKELETKWAYGGWYVEYQVTPFGTWPAYVRLHAGQSLFSYRGCNALLWCCLMLESTSAFWYYLEELSFGFCILLFLPHFWGSDLTRLNYLKEQLF